MKKTLFLFLLFSACHSRMAPTLPSSHWETDLKTAFAQAKGENKTLLMAFSTEWCPYCRYVEEHIFTQKTVAEKLGHFVLLHEDGDAAETQGLMTEHQIVGFPTYLFIDPKGKEILRINDINDVDEFLNLLSDLAVNRPERRDIKKADAFLLADEKTKAFALYQSLFRNLEDSDPLKEEALFGLLSSFDGKKEEGIRWTTLYLQRYFDALYRPDALKKLAAYYSSDALKKPLLEEAAQLIEARLKSLETQSLKIQTVTLDQHIDLLADLYHALGRDDRTLPTYLKSAQLCELKIKRNGGLAQNQNLIGAVAYYYRKALVPQKAIRFLERAKMIFPDYWPVDLALAKSFAAADKFPQARAAADKAYNGAKEVAKSRAALAWAEIEMRAGQSEQAIAVLEKGIGDLQGLGGSDQGRAKKMVEKMQRQMEEYKGRPIF